MPSFKGVIGEEDLVKIIAYIKSLGSNTRRSEPCHERTAPQR